MAREELDNKATHEEILKQFNKIANEFFTQYQEVEIDDLLLEGVYLSFLSKLNKAGWNISESNYTNPTNMIIVQAPEQKTWMLIGIPAVFMRLSKEYMQSRLEFSYSLMDSMWGC